MKVENRINFFRLVVISSLLALSPKVALIANADRSTFSSDSVVITIVGLPSNHSFSDDVFIAGDFNNWNPGDPSSKLKLNSDSTYSIVLSGEGTINYKFTRGTWGKVEKSASCSEISNRTLAFGSVSIIDQTVQNWADLCGNSNPHTATTNVSVVETQFEMPQLNCTRRIWIYLPPGYEISGKKYPVLYMHDGQNLFDSFFSFSGEWGVDESLNQLISKGDNGCIVVGIDNGGTERIDEYSPYTHPTYGGGKGDLYARFIVETLKPFIDSHYRTLPDRENTAIMGSSMGGLISFYTGLKYQEVFSKIGIFSPAFWFSESYFTFGAAIQKPQAMKLYFLAGGQEAGVPEDCQRMIDTLSDNGFDASELKLKTVPSGQHNEAFWKQEFPEAYKWLFATLTGFFLSNDVAPTLYPIPASDWLIVNVSSEFIGKPYSITNIKGEECIRGKIASANDSINIELLPKGHYILNIGGHERRSFKMVKE